MELLLEEDSFLPPVLIFPGQIIQVFSDYCFHSVERDRKTWCRHGGTRYLRITVYMTANKKKNFAHLNIWHTLFFLLKLSLKFQYKRYKGFSITLLPFLILASHFLSFITLLLNLSCSLLFLPFPSLPASFFIFFIYFNFFPPFFPFPLLYCCFLSPVPLYLLLAMF